MRFHRLTNRHIDILRDGLGEMHICLRRFGWIGRPDGCSYSTPGDPHRRVRTVGTALDLFRATTPEEVERLLS